MTDADTVKSATTVLAWRPPRGRSNPLQIAGSLGSHSKYRVNKYRKIPNALWEQPRRSYQESKCGWHGTHSDSNTEWTIVFSARRSRRSSS